MNEQRGRKVSKDSLDPCCSIVGTTICWKFVYFCSFRKLAVVRC